MARMNGRTTSSKTTSALTGLPGSPMTVVAAELPDRQRLAGLDRDPPEVELPALGEHGANVVVAADRDAGGGDDACRRAPRRRPGRARPRRRRRGRAAAAAARRRPRGRPPPARRRSRRGSGAGRAAPRPRRARRRSRQDRDDRATADLDLAEPDRGEHGDRGRRRAVRAARSSRRRACREPRPGRAPPDERPRSTSTSSADSAACSIGTTASAPGGIGAPVMIRAAVPATTVGSSGAPAATSPISRSRPGVSDGADGVAVHRRVREGRHVDRGDHAEARRALARRHRPAGRPRRSVWLCAGQEPRLGLLERQHRLSSRASCGPRSGAGCPAG